MFCSLCRYLLQFCRRGDGVTPPKATPLPTGVMEDEDAQFIGINSKNMAGATPLELAASQGHTEVVKYVRTTLTMPLELAASELHKANILKITFSLSTC